MYYRFLNDYYFLYLVRPVTRWANYLTSYFVFWKESLYCVLLFPFEAGYVLANDFRLASDQSNHAVLCNKWINLLSNRIPLLDGSCLLAYLPPYLRVNSCYESLVAPYR